MKLHVYHHFDPLNSDRLDGIEEELRKLNQKVHKLQMTIDELGDELDRLAAQLNKALQEIIGEIQGLKNVPQSVIDKLNAAKDLAQQLDDLNPDAPPPPP